MDLEANGFSIIVSPERLQPPVGRVYTHEVKVTRIIDRLNGKDVAITKDNSCIEMGKSESEAHAKSAACAKVWAEAQR
jgi:hypothetical protein